MSDHTHVFGWVGHILAKASEMEDEDRKELRRHNIVLVEDEVFERIEKDRENGSLPDGVQMEELGKTADYDTVILAAGVCFAESWPSYGTVFEEAELRQHPAPASHDADAEYLRAMRDTYGLELPKPRMMVGANREH